MFRRLSRWLLAACLLTPAACGSSSSTNVTGPSQVRCAVTLSTEDTSIAPSGGTGEVAVAANRECSWTAASEAAWLTVTEGANGQGNATVTFRAAANPEPAPRTGAIVVNQQRVEIQQAGNPCTYSLGTKARSISYEGGQLSVSVNTQGNCSWLAESQVSWIRVVEGSSGRGDGAVVVEVAANAGGEREGHVEIAGQTFTVTQGAFQQPAPPQPEPEPEPSPPAPPPAPACTFIVTPTSLNLPAELSQGTITVTASAESCQWTATSEAPWLEVTPASGTGTRQLQFTALGNTTGAPRTGTMTVAGQTVTANQAAPAPGEPTCEFTLDPPSVSLPASGGNRDIRVRASAGSCSWSASSNASWISIVGPVSGSGNGEVEISVAANTDTSSRSGTVRIAGLNLTVTQEASAPCQYTVSPTTISVGALGSMDERVSVTAGPTCTWSATSQVSWIVVVDGESGTGNGTVRLRIVPYAGLSPRTGEVTIAGQIVSVQQEGLLGQTVQLDGELSRLAGVCPEVTFRVDREQVRTNAATEFNPSCSSLMNGRDVEVNGVVQSDGWVIATRVIRD